MSFLNKVTVEDLDVKGRRVLVRVDFNVPLKDGKVTNDNRIVGAIPTIRYLADHGAKVILCSHLGKPKGPDAAFTMAPVAARLGELMGRPVLFADDDTVVGENARRMVSEMKDGDILVLQNTRFRPEETKNLPEFSKELASLADVYVDDAFGSAHRAHCSTVGVTDYIKETAVGYLMEKEINYLGNAVEQPVRPLVAILGGAKVADKLKVINNLLANPAMLVMIAACCLGALTVCVLKKLSINYSWGIAIGAGLILQILVVFIGDFRFGVPVSVPELVVGMIGAVIASLIYQLFVFSVDYSRTEYTQFEDDDYYYYVKAVPKIAISRTDVKVQEINKVKRR